MHKAQVAVQLLKLNNHLRLFILFLHLYELQKHDKSKSRTGADELHKQ